MSVKMHLHMTLKSKVIKLHLKYNCVKYRLGSVERETFFKVARIDFFSFFLVSLIIDPLWELGGYGRVSICWGLYWDTVLIICHKILVEVYDTAVLKSRAKLQICCEVFSILVPQ